MSAPQNRQPLSPSLFEIYGEVQVLMTHKERRQAVGLFFLMAAMALLELISIVSVFPFMAVVANPEVLKGDGWLAFAYEASGIPSESAFIVALGLAVFGASVISNSLKAFTTWRMNSFVNLVGHQIAARLVGGYLQQSYEWFLMRHSADLAKNVLSEVGQVVNGIIHPGMTALSRGVVAFGIAAILFLADPMVAGVIVIALGGVYFALYRFQRAFVSHSGKSRFDANRARFHAVSETFAGIKEVKLRGIEATSVARFIAPSERFARYQAVNATLAAVPRYGIEAIAIGGTIGLILYLLTSPGGLGTALPLIALYALAGFRMLPTVQEIYASITKIRFAAPALALLRKDLIDNCGEAPPPAPTPSALPFNRELRLEGVSYIYPDINYPALQDLQLVIPRGTRVGVTGPTGSGKSTLVDILMGLLVPTQGRILVDGCPLDTIEKVRAWRKNIGYVPQSIFISDDTIEANIAFGHPPQEIDRIEVERAARAAQLHDFIVSELPGGYDARVGERGVRLSGGQRQRLGLARALYGNPAVLVLDEATSALDESTEDSVIASINALGEDRTVIMIAHRLRTLRGCELQLSVVRGNVTCNEISPPTEA